MKNNNLFQTNVLIGSIVFAGFVLTAALGYHAGQQTRSGRPAWVFCLLAAGAVLVILLVISSVIRRFHAQVTELVEERQAFFKKATEQLYESIYEMDLTRNCYVGRTTEEYFERLGAGDMPFDQGLRVIADRQIKEEFRQGYINMFSPEHAIGEYQAGNRHLRYDFMISEDGAAYRWMRVDAYLFYSEESHSIHMFAYRKNIDREKKKELQAVTDEMTGLFSKKMTERLIRKRILENGDAKYAFFIFDIDHFKQVNDDFGHLFGDCCICRIVQIMREGFEEKDILGRIGGDEFAAFTAVLDWEQAEKQAGELSAALNTVVRMGEKSCNITVSLGMALYPRDGVSFEELYQRADEGLYRKKRRHGRQGKQPREELTVMQGQIQPHFLYNSLTGIKQLCDTEPKKASEALGHFCCFLRQNLESLSSSSLVPFEKEMEYVREFFYLEKMRFGDKLNLCTGIGESAFLLPPLTLQPIVENAVRYGIMKKKGGGTVTIRTGRKDGAVVITIADDGAGFDMEAGQDDGRIHVGIANVKRRLEIQCGGSLEITSGMGTGTVVTIILPQRGKGY